MLRDQGDLAAALVEYRAGLDIIQRLAAEDPGNAQWQRDLSIGHQSIGDVLRGEGDLAAAFSEYRVALDIIQHLAEKDPGNTHLGGRSRHSTHQRGRRSSQFDRRREGAGA